MKKGIPLLLVTGLILVSHIGWAQTNTFPSSGNVGIGTTSPAVKFHVRTNNAGVKSYYSSAIIESTDSQLDLISSPDGSWGSSINFIDGNGSSNNNIWSIARRTTNSNSSLRFNFGTKNNHNNSTKLTILTSGNLGIGTANPNKRLHVNDPNGNQVQLSDGIDNGWVGFSAPDFTIWNHDIGGDIRFVFGTGSGTERVTFQDNGNVGIGITNPAELLTVAGTAKAEEVIVTEDVGADFVFEEDYALPDLTEVEAYIKQFKHLSGIPIAGEMKREGVKVGELQMKLLQKIEELTLYTIEQQKVLLKQQKRIEALEDELKLLK